jgi:hypothetical protein
MEALAVRATIGLDARKFTGEFVMDRRQFLASGGVAALATTLLPSSAFAQSSGDTARRSPGRSARNPR